VPDRERLSVVEGDVRDRSAVDRAISGVDCVAHLAAVCINKSLADPAECNEVNLVGSRHVFESAVAQGVQRVVFASSASVYGNPQRLPMSEDDDVDPLTPYCRSKVAAEQALRLCTENSGVGWLALRFFNVYGPGQPTDAFYTSVLLTFLRRIAAGEPIVIDGDGSQTMDFVHVDDVARAVTMALDSEASGCALNVGTGVQTSVMALAQAVAGSVGATVRPEFRHHRPLVDRRQADIRRIRHVLGWEPLVALDEGLSTVVQEFEFTA
jgi:UDP-glucose 4-epimerase